MEIMLVGFPQVTERIQHISKIRSLQTSWLYVIRMIHGMHSIEAQSEI